MNSESAGQEGTEALFNGDLLARVLVHVVDELKDLCMLANPLPQPASRRRLGG